MTDREDMYEYVKNDAKENGYYLCPDEDLLEGFIDGLVENEERYGYPSCPCRPASGNKRYDADIICPCEYRDADVEEFGMCYCGLFVSEEVKEDPSKLASIPERRPREIIDAAMEVSEEEDVVSQKDTNIEKKVKKLKLGAALFVDTYARGKFPHLFALSVKQNQKDLKNSN